MQTIPRYGRHKPRRRRRNLKPLGTIATVAVFLALLFVCIWSFSLYSSLQFSPPAMIWNPDAGQRTTFLLAGVHEEELASCMLINIPAEGDFPVYMVQIPVNTVVEQNLGEKVMLKDLFADQGSEAMVNALDDLFDDKLSIRHHVIYSYEMLADLVDSVGEVAVTNYSSFNVHYQDADYVFSQGEISITGERAIPFLLGSGTTAMYREKDLAVAVFNEIFAFRNLGGLVGNLRLTGDHYETDLSLRQQGRMRNTLAAITQDNSYTQLLPGVSETAQGRDYWVADDISLQLLVQQIEEELEGYNREQLVVDVFNGNGVRGFAGDTADVLRNRNFQIGVVADAVSLTSITRIYYQEGFELAALELALILDIEPEFIKGSYREYTNPVAIILGQDMVGR